MKPINGPISIMRSFLALLPLTEPMTILLSFIKSFKDFPSSIKINQVFLCSIKPLLAH